MRNLFLAGLTLAFAFVVVGCGGGMNAEKYEAVLKKYYELNLAAVKDGKDFDSNKAWDEAAKSQGFADKKAFDEAVGKWGNADEAAKIGKKLADEHSKNVQKLAEEKTKEATDKAKEGKE